MKSYLPRIADGVLRDRLEARGAVLIEGPNWCGKTTTARQQAASVLYMQDPRSREQNLRLAQMDPQLLLQGDAPRLIDEWQLAPTLWDAVRFEVDQRDAFNQFILTGSSQPQADMRSSHSGTGCISRMMMRPMSLFESGDSMGQVSLSRLFEGEGEGEVSAFSEADLRRAAFLICRGGWPRAVDQPERVALRQAYDYFDAVVESDMSAVDNVRRDPQRIARLMRSYARFSGSDAKLSTIRADLIANDLGSLSPDTLYSYVGALKAIFVLEYMQAWNPNLRSRTAIRSSDTRHFVDRSIAAAALGIGPNDLLHDLNTMGLLFGTLCARDLRAYVEPLDGSVYHYRDKNGLECDAVLHLRDGSYGLVEVKLSNAEADAAAVNLCRLRDKIDTDRMAAPSFLMMLTTGRYAYTRDDGVLVVPIGCLGS